MTYRRFPAQSAALLAVAASALWLLIRHRYSPVVPVLGAVALGVASPLLGRRRTVLLAGNIALLAAYFWSWDESHTITIRADPSGAIARVDGDALRLGEPLPAGRVGLQQAPYASYRIWASGEMEQGDVTTFWGRVAMDFRLAQPGSAWSSMTITSSEGRVIRPNWSGGGWGRNERGEWTAPENASALARPSITPPFNLTVRLVRPEGAHNILLGVGRSGSGYALQVRFDVPDVRWVRWSRGRAGAVLAAVNLTHMDFAANLQRFVRTLLSGYMLCLFLVTAIAGVYPIFLAALHGFRPRAPKRDEILVLRELVARARMTVPIAIAVGLAGLVLAAGVSEVFLGRIPHVQDSVAYLSQATLLAHGHLSALAPPTAIRNFFREEYMPMYRDRWFSQYPPGWPVVLMLGVLLHVPWLVDPFLAALALVAMYFFGRLTSGPLVALVAALLGLLSPFWLFMAGDMMAHPAGLFFGAVCFLVVAVLETDLDRPGLPWSVVIGLAGGMLFITRQITAVGLLGPLVLYVCLVGRRDWRTYIPGVPAFAVPAIGLGLYNWALMGSPFTSTYAAWPQPYALGFGPHASPLGNFSPADGLWNAYQNLSMLAVDLYGWPYGLALGIALVPFLLGRATRWDWLLLATFLSIVAVHVFYWCACLMYGPRFYYEALPALLLLTARGFAELVRLPLSLWAHWSLPRDATVASAAPGLLMVCLLLFVFRFYMPIQAGLYPNYNGAKPAELRTVQAAGVHKALVFVVGHAPFHWGNYGSTFFANNLDLRGDVIYARDLGNRDRLLYRYFPGRARYRLDNARLVRLP